jgi:predicted ribosome quality control (RQC) complex YloA/Tae2 family protein
MKERFTTIDVFSVLQDLRESLLGMRVANVYDIDHKTYLIRLAKPDVKKVLLFESGCRIHTTEFEWPKSLQPSGFSMKLRKHLRTRRLVAISQLGVDRVVDLQFGSDEAAYHLVIELYDRGNVILTDWNYLILSLLRTRTDTDADVRFAVRETFSLDTVKREQPSPSREQLERALSAAKKGDQLKHVLNPHFVYGAALLSHCLLGAGIRDTPKIGSGFSLETDMDRVMTALEEADQLFRSLRDGQSKGIVVQRREERPAVADPAAEGASRPEDEPLMTNVEFHPMLFRQHAASPHKEFPTLSC